MRYGQYMYGICTEWMDRDWERIPEWNIGENNNSVSKEKWFWYMEWYLVGICSTPISIKLASENYWKNNSFLLEHCLFTILIYINGHQYFLAQCRSIHSFMPATIQPFGTNVCLKKKINEISMVPIGSSQLKIGDQIQKPNTNECQNNNAFVDAFNDS